MTIEVPQIIEPIIEESILEPIYILDPTSLELEDLIKPHKLLFELDSIYEFNNDYGFLYVPLIPEHAYGEFKGLSYAGTQYTWDEVDYRLSVEYIPAIPEPSTAGIFLGIIALCMISFNKLIRRT